MFPFSRHLYTNHNCGSRHLYLVNKSKVMLRRKKLPSGLATMPGIRGITQISVITADADKTIHHLVQALNPGSFKVLSAKAPQLFNTKYKGAAESWSFKAGLTWIGNTQLEIIQPITGRTVYGNYLNSRNSNAGIEHIYLDAENFDTTLTHFEAAGYPLAQEAQLNAKGRLGVLPLPALPKAFQHLAARFGYTETRDKLKLDIELAKFPPGVSQRLALRAAIPEQWIPAQRPYYFENTPDESPLGDLDAFYVLGQNLESLLDEYAKLTDRRPTPERYQGDHLPGKGRMARIVVGTSLLVLVEPEEGPVEKLICDQGEGLCLLHARPKKDVSTTLGILRSRGWEVSDFKTASQRAYARHTGLPFALWISDE